MLDIPGNAVGDLTRTPTKLEELPPLAALTLLGDNRGMAAVECKGDSGLEVDLKLKWARFLKGEISAKS